MKRTIFASLILLIACSPPAPAPGKKDLFHVISPLPHQTVRRKVVNQPKSLPYPAEARRSNIQGETFVGLVVNENGDVTQVIPYSGHSILLEHSILFAKSVKFEANNPTTIDSPVALKIRYGLGGTATVEIIFGFLIQQPNQSFNSDPAASINHALSC